MIVSGFVYARPIIDAKGAQFMFVAKEAAEKKCGCRIYSGVRSDTLDAATENAACCPEHQNYMDEVQADLLKSLDNPTDRKLIDVLNELLGD